MDDYCFRDAFIYFYYSIYFLLYLYKYRREGLFKYFSFIFFHFLDPTRRV